MDKQQYKQEARNKKLTQRGAECIASLRYELDADGEANRPMITCVDGSYTNKLVFRNIPHNTILIGRIRKDAKLFAIPENPITRGRRKCYGEQLPTPEQIRQSKEYEWVDIEAFTTGKVHTFQVKTVAPLRWKPAGGKQNLRLVIVRQKRYATRAGGPENQKDPAYLLCTDCDLSVEQIVQYYFWRWEVEQNFRDEKNILGVGDAQVRTEEAVELLPDFLVAVYALLQLAALDAEEAGDLESIEDPLWRKSKPPQRLSTQKMINIIRAELMSEAMLGETFRDFIFDSRLDSKPLKVPNPFQNAPFYQQE